MQMAATIAILGGTGQQGRGLAQRLAMAGERIVVGSRDPDRARATIAGWVSTVPPVEVADNVTAVTRARLEAAGRSRRRRRPAVAGGVDRTSHGARDRDQPAPQNP